MALNLQNLGGRNSLVDASSPKIQIVTGTTATMDVNATSVVNASGSTLTLNIPHPSECTGRIYALWAATGAITPTLTGYTLPVETVGIGESAILMSGGLFWAGSVSV